MLKNQDTGRLTPILLPSKISDRRPSNTPPLRPWDLIRGSDRVSNVPTLTPISLDPLCPNSISRTTAGGGKGGRCIESAAVCCKRRSVSNKRVHNKPGISIQKGGSRAKPSRRRVESRRKDEQPCINRCHKTTGMFFFLFISEFEISQPGDAGCVDLTPFTCLPPSSAPPPSSPKSVPSVRPLLLAPSPPPTCLPHSPGFHQHEADIDSRKK